MKHMDFTRIVIVDDTGMRHDIVRERLGYDCEQCGNPAEYTVIPDPEPDVIACPVPYCQACLVMSMRHFELGMSCDTFVVVGTPTP